MHTTKTSRSKLVVEDEIAWIYCIRRQTIVFVVLFVCKQRSLWLGYGQEICDVIWIIGLIVYVWNAAILVTTSTRTTLSAAVMTLTVALSLNTGVILVLWARVVVVVDTSF